MRASAIFAGFAAVLPSALAATLKPAGTYTGFNYGSTFSDGTSKQLSDFTGEFNSAKALAGTDGKFTSARLYTMIQGGTTNTPISAIEAAINTQTTLLLGLWASGTGFANEIDALSSALSTYGTAFTNLIAGISVGSEDLYRLTPVWTDNNTDPGAEPDTIISYINEVRSTISGTGAAEAPVGHVDTWTAWVNSSNSDVIAAVDFLGVDAYPYYESTDTLPNTIANSNTTFWDAWHMTKAAAGAKQVWVTETGWPIAGPQDGNAVASVANAAQYWADTACSLFGVKNTWYFTLQDAQPVAPSGGVTFGVVGAGNPPPTTPLYDLSC